MQKNIHYLRGVIIRAISPVKHKKNKTMKAKNEISYHSRLNAPSRWGVMEWNTGRIIVVFDNREDAERFLTLLIEGRKPLGNNEEYTLFRF